MRSRWIALCGLSLPLIFIACNKAQTPASPHTAALAVPTAPAAPAAPAPSGTVELHFTGEVKYGQQFEKVFASDMIFRLAPYAGNDSGWTIRIVPGADSAAAATDCIGAVEAPSHGDTKVEIEPPGDGASQSAAWKHREFQFVPAASDCKAAWSLMNEANYASKLSDKERERASTKLGQVSTRNGKFTILEARFATAAGNPRATIEWLKFDVDLTGSNGLPAAQASGMTEKASAIRSVDLKAFVESHLGELNPDLADLATECGDGQNPLQSLAPILYGDLDGDGQEEAAVEGWSCLSGNGGADFWGVLKLQSGGKIAALPIRAMPRSFEGRNPYEGLRGHMRLEIQDGRLVEIYPTYPNEQACNNCSEGERRFIYRWDGHEFTLDRIINVSEAKTGN